MSQQNSEYWMARALRLARRGLYGTDPNPRVGCVLVRDGAVIGEGWHARAGEAHAEVAALSDCAERGHSPEGATAYVTLEPCSHHGRTPPCAEALVAARVAEVVYGMEDPSEKVAGRGLALLAEAGIRVTGPVLEAEARALNPGFISRSERKRPWVRVKIAASLDGRTAMASGESQWITGEAARRDVHAWRARSSAVLTGIGTVLADDPSLNVRRDDLEGLRQPDRVVLDSRLRTPLEARLLQLDGQAWLLHGADADASSHTAANTVEVAGAGDGLDLAAVLDWCADQEYNEILVEAGPVLNGALLQAGLVDEVLVYLAGHVMGSAARGMFDLPGVDQMADRTALRLTDVRRIGDDLRLTLLPDAATG